jgi:hypothetical protein
MAAMNFQLLKRGDATGSNPRLIGQKIDLHARVIPVWGETGTDAWEDDGGAPAPAPYSVDEATRCRPQFRQFHTKKQMGARCAIPKESIIKVSMGKPVAVGVAKAIFEGKSQEEIEIAKLEARIKELMLAVQRPNPIPMPGMPVADIDGLLAAYNGRKVR